MKFPCMKAAVLAAAILTAGVSAQGDDNEQAAKQVPRYLPPKRQHFRVSQVS
jgi:hypothetical protein